VTYIGPDLTKAYVDQVSHAWNHTIMTAIAGAESGWRTDARSPTDDWGLFQINRYWHKDLFEVYNWANPLDNTKMAYHVWTSQHYRAWSTYNSGAYKKYLGKSGGGYIPSPTGTAEGVWFQDIPAPSGGAGMDYSAKIHKSGARGIHSGTVLHRSGDWLRRLK
jgi:hypothetical protein